MFHKIGKRFPFRQRRGWDQRLFSGLVETMGRVGSVQEDSAGRRLTIDLPEIREGLAPGDSVAINGCCLTVVALGSVSADFQAGPETLERTNLGGLKLGDRVNLERALRADGRLGGHIVQGHIDGTGKVLSRKRDGEWETVWFEVDSLARYLVPKGSIAIDGVSLTVCEVTDRSLSVMLIPHTLSVTTLGQRMPGDTVNIETDILGKYVVKLVEAYLPGIVGQQQGEGSSS